MNNKDNKYSAQHSIERFQERYGITITEREYQKLSLEVRTFLKSNNDKSNADKFSSTKLLSIHKGFSNDFAEVIDVEKTKDGIQYVIKIKERYSIEIFCVYETARDCITTFLPAKSFDAIRFVVI